MFCGFDALMEAFGGIVGFYGDSGLCDYGSCVGAGGDDMDGGSGFADICVDGLSGGVESREVGEEGGVDIEDFIFPEGFAEVRGEDFQESRECDDFDLVFGEYILDGVFEVLGGIFVFYFE